MTWETGLFKIKKPVIVERGRGTTRDADVVYDITWTFDSEFIVLGDCMTNVILLGDDNIMKSATLTLLNPLRDGSLDYLLGVSDTTPPRWDIPANTELELFRVDFNNVFTGLIRLMSRTGGYKRLNVYGSNDGSTWDKLYSRYTGSEDYLATLPGYMYYKVTATNEYYYDVVFEVDMFEAYQLYNAPYRRIVKTDTDKRLWIAVTNGKYHVLEIMHLPI
jgi:hypothetical protein